MNRAKRAGLHLGLVASLTANVVLLARGEQAAATAARIDSVRPAAGERPSCPPRAAGPADRAVASPMTPPPPAPRAALMPSELFDREPRDEAWASPREAYVRPRLEKLARLSHVLVGVAVECRSSCCMVRLGELGDPVSAQLHGDVETLLGLPSGTWEEAGDYVLTCFARDAAVPRAGFVDRLDERIAQAGLVARAEAECAHAGGGPGSLAVTVEVAASGEVRLYLDGDLLGSAAAACVEDLLYDQLRFALASGPSRLRLSLEIGAP